jgi:Flp pilus assembly pilin Flp
MPRSFWTDESGQGLTEYAVILALVSVTLLLVLVALRDEIARVFDIIREEIRSRPGLGQGAGCPSVGGCKPRDGG